MGEIEKTDASENLIYRLMTLVGEHPEDGSISEPLHRANMMLMDYAVMHNRIPFGFPQLEKSTLQADKIRQALLESEVSEFKSMPRTVDESYYLDFCLQRRQISNGDLSSLRSGIISLSGLNFRRAFCLRSSVFAELLHISNCHFDHQVDLTDARLTGGLHIQTSNFSEGILCGNITSTKEIKIEDCEIRVMFDMTSASGRPVNLRLLKVDGAADLDEIKLGTDVILHECSFVAPVYLRKCKTEAVLTCEASTFDNGLLLNGSVFSKVALSERTQIGQSAGFFNGRQSLLTLETYNSDFKIDADFSDVIWPNRFADRRQAREHRKAYERLKDRFAKRSSFQDEHQFNRLELRCREAENPFHVEMIASRVFRYISNYGWSLSRPLGLLVIFWALGTWLIKDFGQLQLTTETVSPLSVWQSMAVSGASLLSFLGLQRTFLSEELTQLNAIGEGISVAQMLIGIVLVFCFGLALRNRFRLK